MLLHRDGARGRQRLGLDEQRGLVLEDLAEHVPDPRAVDGGVVGVAPLLVGDVEPLAQVAGVRAEVEPVWEDPLQDLHREEGAGDLDQREPLRVVTGRRHQFFASLSGITYASATGKSLGVGEA